MKEHCGKKESQSEPNQGEGQGSGGGAASFVLTLWLEPREVEAVPEWRWRVVHVQTGQQEYFQRLTDVLAFITSRSGLPPPR